ncbi:hypothetical protein VIGAN_11158900 [Vigna angularis var. angularis]|uniref:Uncharacterized protein n=1 Tax=Vigna angularis var. angularis TaxID=157739 RepID=A0A0S3TAX0_PHAAN|nr:hypothetical protein VIGAN_11158900 [Vigna angularis var. angularis]
MRVATHCVEGTSIFVFNDGCVERRFCGGGDWELRGIVPKVFFFRREISSTARLISFKKSSSRNANSPASILSLKKCCVLKHFHLSLWFV